MKRVLVVCLALFSAAAWLPVARAAGDALLINGAIVTPDGIVSNGWLAIRDGKIVSITPTKPAIPGARALVTTDMVFPGFIDLHNHPLYGIFPRWKAPRRFDNRYQWRAEPGYLNAIQTPEGKLVGTHFCDIDAYVELQALAGGTTSLLGIYEPADTPTIPACVKGLVRNLDWASGFHSAEVGHEPIANVLGVRPNDVKLSPQAMAMLKAGQFDLLAVHLAEGRRADTESRGEFKRLKELNLLTSKTAIIHGVALTAPEFAEMHAAGAALIWSPRSNYELYGETADIAAVVREKVTLALAPDWSPTGSMNMLAEIAYAMKVDRRDFSSLLSAKQLFEMATIIPARIAHIADKVGSLAPGLQADLFLLHATGGSDVFAALARARPEDVTLAMVGGEPLYGAPGHLRNLGGHPGDTVTVCGKKRAVARGLGYAGIKARLAAAMAREHLKLADIAECSR